MLSETLTQTADLSPMRDDLSDFKEKDDPIPQNTINKPRALNWLKNSSSLDDQYRRAYVIQSHTGHNPFNWYNTTT